MKSLKIAEIVPVSCLEYIEDNQYHMCLAHLVMSEEENAKYYTSFYKCMADEGKYVLMDNGAAEGSQLSFEDLIEAYKRIRPTEIVLPDELCDAEKTVEKTLAFYSRFKHEIRGYKIMVVPQGKTFDEWCKCAIKLMTSVPVDTIGVSKFLEMETGEKNIRVRACEFLKDYDVEIHLLGCSEGPSIVKKAREVNEKVRGCDSAFVYIYSKTRSDHINLNTTRPKGDIDFLFDSKNDDLPGLMAEFETSIGVENNKTDETWRN